MRVGALGLPDCPVKKKIVDGGGCHLSTVRIWIIQTTATLTPVRRPHRLTFRTARPTFRKLRNVAPNLWQMAQVQTPQMANRMVTPHLVEQLTNLPELSGA
jgi:hypothetical protein